MLDWDKLRIFHTVAESGSLTAAGDRLNVSQSAVSRQIRTLEEGLKTALFTRHARGLVLTAEGRSLFETTSDVLGRIDQAERTIMESKDRPRGTLRVTTMLTFGSVWLTQHIRGFMDRFPDIRLELKLSDTELDLATGEADVAIRLSRPDHGDVIARPLMTFHAYIYASPDYLEKRGTPVTPQDLALHDIISFSTAGATPIRGLDWLVRVGPGQQSLVPKLRIDNLYGVMHAVEAGLGVAVLPDYLVQGRRGLVRILPQVAGTHYEAFYCYAPELRGTKRVNLFYDHLRDQARHGTLSDQ